MVWIGSIWTATVRVMARASARVHLEHFSGEVDPVRRRKCDAKHPRADPTSGKSAVGSPWGAKATAPERPLTDPRMRHHVSPQESLFDPLTSPPCPRPSIPHRT